MSTLFCSHCGQPIDAGQRVCSNCGKEQPPLPVLEGKPPPGAPPEKLLTRAAWGDIVLGIVLALGSVFLYGVGILVPLVLYFVLKPTYPVFARGLGYGLLTFAALLLGLIALCFAIISTGSFGLF